MKNLYTFLVAALLTAPVSAQIAISSAMNGNATNPLTWSCQCIPSDGDSITISHTITLDVDYAYTMGGITITPTGVVNGNTGTRILGVSGGYFNNDGAVTVGYFAHNGGSVANVGIITASSSVLIDNSVTLYNYGMLVAGDSTYINTNATLQNNSSWQGGVCLNAGTINHQGSAAIVDDMLSTGTIQHTGIGYVNVQGSLYNTGNATFGSNLYVAGDIWNAENMTVNNDVNAQSLINGDTINGTATFTINGQFSELTLSNSLFNSETLTGNGKICVIDSTINSGSVTGTLDMCDASGGSWDLNVGTEAGTVTHCAAGPCFTGIQEASISSVGISPNPANEIIKLQLPKADAGVVEVIDVTGRVVMRENIAGKEMLLNVFALPEGIYTISVVGETQQYTGRFVKQ